MMSFSLLDRALDYVGLVRYGYLDLALDVAEKHQAVARGWRARASRAESLAVAQCERNVAISRENHELRNEVRRLTYELGEPERLHRGVVEIKADASKATAALREVDEAARRAFGERAAERRARS